MLKESCYGHMEGRLYCEARPQSLGELARDSAFVCDIELVLFCNPGPGLLRHPLGLSCCAGLKAGTAR